MNSLYDVGTLVLVFDPYDHIHVLCVVTGIATVSLVGTEEDILYSGYCFYYNNPYYFFDSDIVCRAADYD